MSIRYLHTMVRVTDLDKSMKFYCEGLGLREFNRKESEKGRFTLVFLAAPEDIESAPDMDQPIRAGIPMVELTYNWDPEDYDGGRNFGHLAYEVENIYDICEKLENIGVTINRPPRDGNMAFVRSPDNISIELLQKVKPLPPHDKWANAENIGDW
jgi:lactoylglutathione lyase